MSLLRKLSIAQVRSVSCVPKLGVLRETQPTKLNDQVKTGQRERTTSWQSAKFTTAVLPQFRTANAPVVIRRARHSDFDSIQDIGDVYQGRDDLLGNYHKHLNNPWIFPMVAELDGRVVGYCMNQVLDNGQTGLLRDARVHKDFRNQGIFPQLFSAQVQQVVEFQPPLTYQATTVTNMDTRAADKYREIGCKEVVIRNVVNLKFNASAIKNFSISQKDAQYISSMDRRSVAKLFANEAISEQLFPQKRLVIDQMPYRLMDGNVPYVVNAYTDAFASSNVEIHNSLNEKPTIGAEDSLALIAKPPLLRRRHYSGAAIEEIDMVTFSCYCFIGAELVYTLDMYSKPGLPHLDLHVRLLLQAISSLTDGVGTLSFSFDNKADEDGIISCLKHYGISELDTDMETGIIVFEKTLS